jgi:hypothetical protein
MGMTSKGPTEQGPGDKNATTGAWSTAWDPLPFYPCFRFTRSSGRLPVSLLHFPVVG